MNNNNNVSPEKKKKKEIQKITQIENTSIPKSIHTRTRAQSTETRPKISKSIYSRTRSHSTETQHKIPTPLKNTLIDLTV